MDAMLAAALPFAQQMLDKHGAFAPYAVSMNSAGEIGMVAAHAASEHPETAEVLADLYDGLRTQSVTLRAVGVASDVTLANSGEDAIHLEIEHREGVALGVVLPYRKNVPGKGVAYGGMSAIPAQRRVWPPKP